MNLIKFGTAKGPGIYKKAANGAYMGIINLIIILYPFIFELAEKKEFFSLVINSIIIILMIIIFIIIIKLSKNTYNYSAGQLKLLIFTALMEFCYVGIYCYYLYNKLHVNLLSSDIIILFVYVILALISGILILMNAIKGYDSIRRTYTRTFKKILLSMIIYAFWGIIVGGVFAIPFFVNIGNLLGV